MVTPRELFDFDGFYMEEIFAGTQTPWGILSRIKPFLEERVKAEVRGTVHPGAVVEGEVFIDEGAVVEPGAFIQGPTWIGKNSHVRHGAYVRGSAAVGAGCIVGHATEVKNSIFLDGSKAGHFAYVGDCVLGKGVNLGAGTKLANFKLDGGNVSLPVDGRTVDTGLRKFGALLGDDVQTGCNSVTSPGTVLGRGSWVYANTTVPRGIYPAGHILLSQGRRLVVKPKR